MSRDNFNALNGAKPARTGSIKPINTRFTDSPDAVKTKIDVRETNGAYEEWAKRRGIASYSWRKRSNKDGWLKGDKK